MSKILQLKVKGHPLKCQHCGGDRFTARAARLETFVMHFVKWSERVEVFTCSHCGFLHWFVDPAEEAVAVDEILPVACDEPPADDLTEPTECLACGTAIPTGATLCPSCGWTYK